MSYRVAVAGLRVELTEDEAHALWDDWPEEQRTGARDGTFILWDLDPNGRRCCPMVCRHLASKASSLATELSHRAEAIGSIPVSVQAVAPTTLELLERRP